MLLINYNNFLCHKISSYQVFKLANKNKQEKKEIVICNGMVAQLKTLDSQPHGVQSYIATFLASIFYYTALKANQSLVSETGWPKQKKSLIYMCEYGSVYVYVLISIF